MLTSEVPSFGAVENEGGGKKSMIPSSIGLTFAVKGETEALKITVRWGAYLRQVDEEAEETKRYWQRVPIEAETLVSLAEWRARNKRRWDWTPSEDYPAVTLQGLLDEHGDALTITLFLVNGQVEPKQRKDQAWLFQPEIIVETPDLAPAFIRRRLPDGLAPTEVEDNIMRMIYRKQVEFAVGHGIAVHAELADERWDAAQRISTEVLPRAEVLRMEPRPIDNLTVDMRALAETEAGDFAPALMPLVEDYAGWIAERDAEIAGKPADLEPFDTETAVVRRNGRRRWSASKRASNCLMPMPMRRALSNSPIAPCGSSASGPSIAVSCGRAPSQIWPMSICQRTGVGVLSSWLSFCSICQR